MTVVIGLDLGTTHCKAVAVRADGEVLRSAVREVTSVQPRAEDIAAAAEAVLGETADDADAIALSGAMHSVVPVDERAKPQAAAMTWADTRCEAQWREIDAEARRLYPTTGCPSHTTYHPARLRFFGGEHHMYPGLRDYVAHHLTGKWACDIGMASTTGLLDIHKRTWCDDALALAGVRAEQLPPLVEPDAIIGEWRGKPIIIGTSDGALANVGAGAAEPERTVITVGTSGAVRQVCALPRLDDAQRTWCYCFFDGQSLVGGAINNAGLLMKWLRGVCFADLNGDDVYDVMLREADAIAPGAEGVTLLPYLSGERSPHYRADLRASMHGLTHAHGRAHIVRAAAEATAYCLRDVCACLPTCDAPARLTGGITRFAPWVQIAADVLDRPLEVVDAADASALGAARVGHRALGSVADLDAWDGVVGRRVEPDLTAAAAYDAAYNRFKDFQMRDLQNSRQ